MQYFFVFSVLVLVSLASASSLSSTHLLEAFDAGLVRTIDDGGYLEAYRMNYSGLSFRAVASWSCGAIPSNFPYPQNPTGMLQEAISTGILKMGTLALRALPDINTIDEPHTGFWVEYVRRIVDHINDHYNSAIKVQRINYDTSTTLLQALLDGEVHLTEPYFIIGGFWESRARHFHFDFSCTSLGYDSTFFTVEKNITTLDSMVASISKGAKRSIGFLSEGNFHSVQPVLPSEVEPIYYVDQEHLEEAVNNGTILAGLLSGKPNGVFNEFSSTIISPRAAFFRSDSDPPNETSSSCRQRITFQLACALILTFILVLI